MARPSTGPFASDRVPSSPQAIRAAEARADQVGDGGCLKRQAEEELSYAAQAIDKTAGSMRLAEIEEGPLFKFQTSQVYVHHVRQEHTMMATT